MTVYEAIAALVQYGIDTGLTPECERIYTTNQLLEIMQLDDYEEPAETTAATLEEILDVLLADACSRGLTQDSVVYRDLFDTKLMNALMPRPSQVREAFWKEYKESPEKATEYFYKLSQDSNYIRRYRVCKDMKWMTATEYGDLDITINLSKPEKDPKAIAAARTQKQSGYPKCLLCIQNEGYAGRVNHPARQNHRIIPITINQSQWGFQYSPYVYYNEHCIVFCGEHSPMKIDRSTFVKLFDFVGQFPHYFLGSNADLPIVGGSILTHDHFQGGHYEFAMAKAPIETPVTIPGYEDVEAGIVKWPMSVIRIRHNDRERLIDLADHILKAWRGYQLLLLHHRHKGLTPMRKALSLLRQMESHITQSRQLQERKTVSSSLILCLETTSQHQSIRLAFTIRTKSCIISREKISVLSKLWVLPYCRHV